MHDSHGHERFSDENMSTTLCGDDMSERKGGGSMQKKEEPSLSFSGDSVKTKERRFYWIQIAVMKSSVDESMTTLSDAVARQL